MLEQDLAALPLLSPHHLYGLTEPKLVSHGNYRLETRTLTAFLAMQAEARLAGFELALCSAYRDFTRQLSIWNAKALGQRPVLDSQSCPMDITELSDDDLIDAILLWSALPGASRHHWGTDIDVFDANAIKQSDLCLITAEYQDGGPCHDLHTWLVNHAPGYGFYFPYQVGQSGVSPEPWHLSYFPVSSHYLAQFNTQDFHQVLALSPIALKEALLPRLTQLTEHFVHFVAPAPAP